MTEVVNLMMEHFRVLRADIAGVKDEIASMRAEMREMRQMAEAHAAWCRQRLAERQSLVT